MSLPPLISVDERGGVCVNGCDPALFLRLSDLLEQNGTSALPDALNVYYQIKLPQKRAPLPKLKSEEGPG